MGRSKRDLVRPMGGTELYLLIFKELYAGGCVQVLFNGLMPARQNHAALRAWIIGWEVPLWQRVSPQLDVIRPTYKTDKYYWSNNMDMYCTEDELILIRQGLKKRDETPSYQLQPDEIVALTCALVRGGIKTLLLDSPEDNPPPKVTSTLDAQTPLIQKKIRRHELELRVALACGVTDFELELNLCGLTKDFVSSDVVLCCLSELLKERCIREMLGYGSDDLSVEQQAEQKGLVMVNPDRKRGQYVGGWCG